MSLKTRIAKIENSSQTSSKPSFCIESENEDSIRAISDGVSRVVRRANESMKSLKCRAAKVLTGPLWIFHETQDCTDFD